MLMDCWCFTVVSLNMLRPTLQRERRKRFRIEFIFPQRKQVESIRQNKKCRQMGSKLMLRFIVA